MFSAATLRDAALGGDVASGKVEAGQSAGLVDTVLPARTLVADIVEEHELIVCHLPLPIGATVGI